MKRKIFLLFVMLSTVACLLAISTSASEYYKEWGETEIIEDIGVKIEDVLANVKADSQNARVKLSCTCEKGSHTYPTYYIMSINAYLRDLFNRDYTAINEHNPCGATYGKDSIIAIEVPEGIASTYFNGGRSATFSSHELLEYVKLPSTMTTICKYAFADNTKLEFVEFNENCNITILQDSAFNSCTSLVGICLPDSITTFENACFVGDYNLGPVYLPKNLKNIGTDTKWNTFQGGEYGNGVKPTKMFFTNEKFTNPTEVDKPSVYYMPSQLTYMDNGIRGASNINDVIVFPETFTTVSSNYVFCGLGGTEEKSKKIVFLGDMISIPFAQETSISYVDFYFMNENDSLSQGDDFHGFSRQAGSGSISKTYIYSCADKKALSIVSTFYGEANWSEDLFKHLVDDSKTVKTEASCTNNEIETVYCFCGEMIASNEKENTFLGHNNDLNSGAVLAGISYTVDGKTDYMSKGYKTITCARCGIDNNDTVAEALFILSGISVNDEQTEMCISFTINNLAISEFENINSIKLNFGVVACYAGDDNSMVNPLTIQNGALSTVNNAIMAEITDNNYVGFDFRLSGFSANKDDAYKDYGFVMGAYVYDGENIYYLGNTCNTVATPIIFNQVLSSST